MILPTLAIAALGSGVAVAAWPAAPADGAGSNPAYAPSAPASTLVAAAPIDDSRRTDRADRSNGRPALAPAPSAPGALKAGAGQTLAAAVAAVEEAQEDTELDVTGTKYAMEDLNVRVKAADKAKVVDTLDFGSKVKVTSTVSDGFRLIESDGDAGWVKNEYLAKKKPAASGVTMKACRLGSGMESGLTSDAILVHRTLCANYPQVTSFGGSRSGGGFHATGQAVDAMISDSGAGWRMARWLQANASKLGVSELIYEQKIWTVQRSGEGWRPMSDRGSVSANHYDHVHISVYGSRATR